MTKKIKVQVNEEEYQGHVEVGEPTRLELQGLIKTMDNIINQLTHLNNKDTNYYIRDYTYKDKNYEVELEDLIEIGSMENREIASVFKNRGGQVLLKIYNKLEDDYEFYKVVM